MAISESRDEVNTLPGSGRRGGRDVLALHLCQRLRGGLSHSAPLAAHSLWRKGAACGAIRDVGLRQGSSDLIFSNDWTGRERRPSKGSDMARIMVVDDDSSVRRMLSQYLKSEGYDVLEAESGEQALSYARDSASDLILLDIEMPGIDGLETLRRLRREAPDSVVVMVSGINDEQRAVRSLEEGARDYIRKPFELQHLRAILQQQLTLRP